MKKYIKPVTEIFENCSTISPITASVVKGDRYQRFGNGDPNEPYGNNDWVNEGYDPNDIIMGGDDNGEMDSRAKGSIVFWDDEEEEEW